jgi:glycosyltransferase involved in cell wall biosynthesis
MPKVSIIIPVHNAEKYLRQCLYSAVNQTLSDIEIICIDDCSTDKSRDIINQYASSDKRIKPITYNTNKSASQARKDGVSIANGEYILFLDADDYIEPDTCSVLYTEILRLDVDVLHFNAVVENCGNIPDSRIKSVEKLLLPYPKKLQGKDVFEYCFLYEKYGFTLWNKMFSASLCKKAFQHIPDGKFPKAQDLYAYFSISFFADSYYGLSNRKAFYHYCFGRGITGHEWINCNQLERYCKQSYVVEGIKSFLMEQECYSEYKKVFHKYEMKLFEECLFNWLLRMEEDQSAKGFDILTKYWGSKKVITTLAKKRWYDRDVIANRICDSLALKPKRGYIKTIAVYYHHIENGGVQRVLSIIIPIWIQMGYKVILFTDTEPSINDYYLPEGVERIVLQSYIMTDRNNFEVRFNQWADAIKKHQVDVVVYHAWMSPLLFWDMISLKSCGLHFIINTHSVFSAPLVTFQNSFYQMPSIYSIADAIISASTIDCTYWSYFTKNALFIPNPIDKELREVTRSDLKNRNLIWIGRFSEEKQPMHALRIMELVVKSYPDAKLYMVGTTHHPNKMDKYFKECKRLKLTDNVEFCGFKIDVGEFYQASSIHLLLSKYEGFSMTLAESKAYGLPTVMYEMPYLEMARDNKGIISVKQGDVKGAAKEIIRLFSDDELRCRLGNEANISLKKYLDFDHANAWENVFASLLAPEKEKLPSNNKIIVETIISHYKSCWEKVQNEISALKKQSTGSLGSRARRMLTGLVRMIYNGIRYYREKGFKYTYNRLLEKLGIIK